MICDPECPRRLNDCTPMSNMVASDGSSFVCMGINDPDTREIEQDKYRHCFVNEETDTMFDYDDYDVKTVIAVMSSTLLLQELDESVPPPGHEGSPAMRFDSGYQGKISMTFRGKVRSMWKDFKRFFWS